MIKNKNRPPLEEAEQSSEVAAPVKTMGAGGGVSTPFTGEQFVLLRQLAEILRMASPPAENAVNQAGNSESLESSLKFGREEAAILVDAALARMYRRLPRPTNAKKGIPAERCPWTGMTRNQFYEVFDQSENGQPIIKNVSMREEGETHAARFYNVGSALAYLDRLAEQQARDGNA